jgi:glycosyltransferase involved in cell wall biosynthesis
MRLGVVVGETWDFFNEVYADLSAHHHTSLYEKPAPIRLPVLSDRLNRYRFHRDLSGFLKCHDVVFFEWASEMLAAATALPKMCKIVTRLHRFEMYEWASRVNWDQVDRVILVSHAKLDEFSAAYPRHAHKATVIPEAVSVDRFQPASKRDFRGNIGILCHLKPRKRVYELVLTFRELISEGYDLHLHIGGGRTRAFGDYYEAVVRIVNELGLQDRVTFYGHVSRPEEWYPLIDVFVSNGYSEGLQVAPLEAMASGCYCLSHHWAGADELFSPENLFYTNSELKERLVNYVTASSAEKAAASERLRRLVTERFNVDLTKVQIRRVVEDAANDGTLLD